MVKVPRCTETGETPGDQGARRANIGNIQPTSNAERRDASPGECSGTFATGCQAKVLLLDEPTAALTDVEAARLFALVRALRADGVGCVYISHRLEEVMALADRVSVLRDGRLMATLRSLRTHVAGMDVDFSNPLTLAGSHFVELVLLRENGRFVR